MTLRIKESALHSNHEAQGKSTCLLNTIENPALLPFPYLSIQKNSELSSVVKLYVVTFGSSLYFFKRTSPLEVVLPRSNSLIKYYGMAVPIWYPPKKSNSLCQEHGFYFTVPIGVA